MHGDRWRDLSAVGGKRTHLEPATWTLEKYPDAPTLTPGEKVALLDQDGPGVVTLLHASNYSATHRGDPRAAAELILRVWYDGEAEPSIEMPLMDFLGDPEMATPPYYTIHCSRVLRSHNFRKTSTHQLDSFNTGAHTLEG